MLVTHYADCVPIYFYDPYNRVMGYLIPVERNTLRYWRRDDQDYEGVLWLFSRNVYIAFGPHIKTCCFEVDKDVAEAFNLHMPGLKLYYKRADKWIIDLERIILRNLIKQEFQKKKFGCRVCTKSF